MQIKWEEDKKSEEFEAVSVSPKSRGKGREDEVLVSLCKLDGILEQLF